MHIFVIRKKDQDRAIIEELVQKPGGADEYFSIPPSTPYSFYASAIKPYIKAKNKSAMCELCSYCW